MGNIGTAELIIGLVVIMVLFGAKRLPDAARGLGQSLKIFKAEVQTPAPRVEPEPAEPEPAEPEPAEPERESAEQTAVDDQVRDKPAASA